MPRQPAPDVDNKRSPPRQPQSSLASTIPGISLDAPPQQAIQSVNLPSVDTNTPTQPTYSQTILQPPTLATDLPPLQSQTYSAGPSSSTSRRQSTGSMRNASMTFENVTPSQTPTGRVSKAKKGKRVHACEYPGCGKVFTRAEHRRRHEQNHNPDAMFKCPEPGCGKDFHRLDLLQRHQERHDTEGSPSLTPSRPHHSSIYTSPPSVLPSGPASSSQQQGIPRTTSGSLSIGSLVNPHQQRAQYPYYSTPDASTGFGMFVANYPQTAEPYCYASDGSHSPASEHITHYHRPSISSSSSVYEPATMSPTMTTSMPGTWVPATAAPPVVLPSTYLEEGQVSYGSSPTVNAMPVQHLHELDGHEFTTIQRELSTRSDLIFDSTRPELPRYIRSDCLEHYWRFFHPSFPIVYKPNFVTNTPPPLLLSAVLAIGSFYDSRPDAKLYSLALQEIATKLLRQRESITHRSRIADLQTVLLLEILGKYCARRTAPEMSSRFRGLFASLHQTRQILVQNPLAVYKTLKPDRSEDDLKRAHKFWLEHEARRRIFHACTVLDAQQVSLFSQPPTVITHMSASSRLPDTKNGIDLPCDEELWEASPIEAWTSKAALVIPQDVTLARQHYQTAHVSDYSFFQHQIININSDATQRCSEELSSPPEQTGVLSKTRFNYHVFQMAKNMPVRDILIVAGESWFLGRKIEPNADFMQSKTSVRQWINGKPAGSSGTQLASSIRAYWHALKVLRMIINIDDSQVYFRSTNMLHEDWSVYLAALVCWAHSFVQPSSRTGAQQLPSSTTTSPSNSRKRKNTQTDITPSKRQATAQLVSPSVAAHTTPILYASSAATYNDPRWATYSTPVTWSNPYYDATLLAYPTHTEASSTTDPSTYAPSVGATATSRTATNTPASTTSHVTTAAVASSLPLSDDPMAELKAYLVLTDVPSPEALASLDQSQVQYRVKSVLEAIRLYKIGPKRTVGGLMNDAEQVLAKLSEGRGGDMF